MTVKEFVRPFRIDDGRKFRLKDCDPAETLNITSKRRAEKLLKQGIAWLSKAQEKLYAQDRWSLLLIFQAMDAAGKDGAIKHVMSGVNPQGCQVYSFRAPSNEDLDHDFMWRTTRCLPERGRIGIFNRSYYEEVLVVRVRKELLDRQKLPKSFVTKRIWEERYEDINAFERYLTREVANLIAAINQPPIFSVYAADHCLLNDESFQSFGDHHGARHCSFNPSEF